MSLRIRRSQTSSSFELLRELRVIAKEQMIIYCTYCSAEKDDSPEELPAIDRYLSDRIKVVAQMAEADEKSFYIFSGKYGLVERSEPIPFYDHLLTEDEVEKHCWLVSKQLLTLKVTKVKFYSRSIEDDPNVKAYQDCLARACAIAGVGYDILAFED